MFNNQQKSNRPDGPKSRASVSAGRYRPKKNKNQGYRYAFSLDPATIEYKDNMLSLVTNHELATARADISKEDENRINGIKKKRRKNGPRLSGNTFAGLSLNDIEI